jgi:hypothetical protein
MDKSTIEWLHQANTAPNKGNQEMNTYEIKVTWNEMFEEFLLANGEEIIIASKTFEFKTDMNIDEICEAVFRDTNNYSGEIWEAMQASSRTTSTHRALGRRRRHR